MRAVASLGVALLLAGCGGQFSGPPPVTAAMAGARGDVQQLAAGRKVFVNRCIECHALPQVAAHSAAAWPRIIKVMAKRADLTPSEHEALVSYILAAQGK